MPFELQSPLETQTGELRRLVPAIVERLPAILAEVGEQLAAEHPAYAAFLSEEFDEIVAGAELFAVRVVALAEQGPQPERGFASDIERALFAEIGHAHFQQGQELEPLLSAYRIGASVAWRHIADAALQRGVDTEHFAGLAAAVFAAVEELSAATLRGYGDEVADRREDRERSRRELAELLLAEHPAPAFALEAAAERAGWPLPRHAAVVVGPASGDGAALARLDGSCLVVRREVPVAIVPDPAGPGRRDGLVAALRGSGVVVGPEVPLDRLAESLDAAALAARLMAGGQLHGDPAFVDDHLAALIVHRDERLLAMLRRQCLAPLAGLPEPTADRLAETLASWLLHMGKGNAVAADLHVHPQTVRYRVNQLRELFGEDLEDPLRRADLLLVLTWAGT